MFFLKKKKLFYQKKQRQYTFCFLHIFPVKEKYSANNISWKPAQKFSENFKKYPENFRKIEKLSENGEKLFLIQIFEKHFFSKCSENSP